MVDERIVVQLDAVDNASSKLSNLTNSISKLTAMTTSITSLTFAFSQFNDIQEQLVQKQLKVDNLNLQIKKDYEDLSKIIAKYGEDSEQARNKLEEIRIEQEKLRLAQNEVTKAQQQQGLVFLTTAMNMGNMVVQLASSFTRLNSVVNIVGNSMKLAFITNPVGLAIMGISTAVLILTTNMFGLRDALVSTLNQIYEFLRNLPIIGQFIEMIANSLQSLSQIFNPTATTNVEVFSLKLENFAGQMSNITERTEEAKSKVKEFIGILQTDLDKTGEEVSERARARVRRLTEKFMIERGMGFEEAQAKAIEIEKQLGARFSPEERLRAQEAGIDLVDVLLRKLDHEASERRRLEEAVRRSNKDQQEIGRNQLKKQEEGVMASWMIKERLEQLIEIERQSLTRAIDRVSGSRAIPRGFIGMETYEDRKTGVKRVTGITDKGEKVNLYESTSNKNRTNYYNFK